MEDGYKVCLKNAQSEFTEKKSRFISYLACVENEDDAKKFIDSVREKHRDATHNCYAYRLRTPRVERFSDDGEPAGTAGMPMLEVLKKEDVYNVCVVVTRYFGGILLGGGGLVRAYSRGAAGAVVAAGFAKRLAAKTFTVTYAYSHHNNVLKYLQSVTHNLVLQSFGEKVTLTLSLAACDFDAFSEKLLDITGGSADISGVLNTFDSFN